MNGRKAKAEKTITRDHEENYKSLATRNKSTRNSLGNREKHFLITRADSSDLELTLMYLPFNISSWLNTLRRSKQ